MNMTEVFTNIPFRLTAEQVIRRSRLRNRNTPVEKMVKTLVDSVLPIARPKAVYRVAYVANKNGDSVEIDGVKFTSHVLRFNLDKLGRVFPYVATCGRELAEFTLADADIVESFFLDIIKGMATTSAVDFLTDHLKEKYALGQVSHMNPGSLPDWPITQQKQLFSLLDNVEGLIGVRLSENCTMHPLKSVSGICFPTEVRFESCQLCPRERCIGRRAPYSPEIAQQLATR